MEIEFKNKFQPLLTVRQLSLAANRFGNIEEIVSDISFDISKSTSIGFVGESGSGKTLSALAILDILPAEILKASGSIYFQGELVTADQQPTFLSLRGKNIAMIFQDAAACLNPVFRVGRQITDIIQCHFPIGESEAKQRTLELLDQVGLPNSKKIYRCYPHELSGGMAQRIMIAMALSCQPKLIIADEPTTALDVKTQLQIIRLIKSLQQKYNFSLLLITHDIHLISDLVEEVMILYQGKIIEKGPVKELQQHPKHTYTNLLLNSGLHWSTVNDQVLVTKK
jgi:peptide/nickel transport system ATP-binding protein